MAPPCRVFEASELPHEIQFNQGKRRKLPPPTPTPTPTPTTTTTTTQSSGSRPTPRKIDLATCELFAMTQYDCQIDRPEIHDSPVRCWPVQRWFRRCRDRKGSFMVETTKWEGTGTGNPGMPSPPPPPPPQQQ